MPATAVATKCRAGKFLSSSFAVHLAEGFRANYQEFPNAAELEYSPGIHWFQMSVDGKHFGLRKSRPLGPVKPQRMLDKTVFHAGLDILGFVKQVLSGF